MKFIDKVPRKSGYYWVKYKSGSYKPEIVLLQKDKMVASYWAITSMDPLLFIWGLRIKEPK